MSIYPWYDSPVGTLERSPGLFRPFVELLATHRGLRLCRSCSLLRSAMVGDPNLAHLCSDRVLEDLICIIDHLLDTLTVLVATLTQHFDQYTELTNAHEAAINIAYSIPLYPERCGKHRSLKRS